MTSMKTRTKEFYHKHKTTIIACTATAVVVGVAVTKLTSNKADEDMVTLAMTKDDAKAVSDGGVHMRYNTDEYGTLIVIKHPTV